MTSHPEWCGPTASHQEDQPVSTRPRPEFSPCWTTWRSQPDFLVTESHLDQGEVLLTLSKLEIRGLARRWNGAYELTSAGAEAALCRDLRPSRPRVGTPSENREFAGARGDAGGTGHRVHRVSPRDSPVWEVDIRPDADDSAGFQAVWQSPRLRSLDPVIPWDIHDC